MTFERNGIVFTITYSWRRIPMIEGEKMRANICPLFWMTVISILVVWPIKSIAYLIGWAVRIVGAIPALLLCGYRPAGPSWRFNVAMKKAGYDQIVVPFVPIKRWPKIGGEHAMPIAIILLIFVVVGVLFIMWLIFRYVFLEAIYLIINMGQTIFSNSSEIINSSYTFYFFILAVTVAIFIFVRKTELWQMLKGFIKAKRDKICFEVEFK